MRNILSTIPSLLGSFFRSGLSLEIEILARWHQRVVYQRSGKCPRIRPAGRILGAWLARIGRVWPNVLLFVKPVTSRIGEPLFGMRIARTTGRVVRGQMCYF